MSPRRFGAWREGYGVGTLITPLMIRHIVVLTQTRSAVQTAQTIGCNHRETTVSTIRYVEAKVGGRLFDRTPSGPFEAAWTPRPEAKAFIDWCKANPKGGLDYPKVAP